MSNGIPTIEEAQNCNIAEVYLKNQPEKTVKIIVQGTFEQIYEDCFKLVLRTNQQYAVFNAQDVSAVHFYRSNH